MCVFVFMYTTDSMHMQILYVTRVFNSPVTTRSFFLSACVHKRLSARQCAVCTVSLPSPLADRGILHWCANRLSTSLWTDSSDTSGVSECLSSGAQHLRRKVSLGRDILESSNHIPFT